MTALKIKKGRCDRSKATMLKVQTPVQIQTKVSADPAHTIY